MIFLRLLEIFLIGLAFYIAVFEMLFPVLEGKKMFPFFRKERRAAENKIAELNETDDIRKLKSLAKK